VFLIFSSYATNETVSVSNRVSPRDGWNSRRPVRQNVYEEEDVYTLMSSAVSRAARELLQRVMSRSVRVNHDPPLTWHMIQMVPDLCYALQTPKSTPLPHFYHPTRLVRLQRRLYRLDHSPYPLHTNSYNRHDFFGSQRRTARFRQDT
jgi:hypothetical protein